MAYVPEWARPDSPTRGMSQAEIAAYYKRHGLASDCRFALREGNTHPPECRLVWAALLAELEHRAPTAADRKLVDQLRAAWRASSFGWPYTVPSFTPKAVKTRKAPAVGCCPTCGQRTSVAA